MNQENIEYQIRRGRYYISNGEVRIREFGGNEYDDCYHVIPTALFIKIVKNILK
jgi:hypothetical protein